mgnify:CR=1 FL=1
MTRVFDGILPLVLLGFSALTLFGVFARRARLQSVPYYIQVAQQKDLHTISKVEADRKSVV